MRNAMSSVSTGRATPPTVNSRKKAAAPPAAASWCPSPASCAARACMLCHAVAAGCTLFVVAPLVAAVWGRVPRRRVLRLALTPLPNPSPRQLQGCCAASCHPKNLTAAIKCITPASRAAASAGLQENLLAESVCFPVPHLPRQQGSVIAFPTAATTCNSPCQASYVLAKAGAPS